MARLHDELRGMLCEGCGVRVGTQLHHIRKRSQGGDDSRSNLEWLLPVHLLPHPSALIKRRRPILRSQG